jgi:SAM-dependent methyltransferase
MRFFRLLAFSRIPGNAFSFWVRRMLHWSRGTPALCQEPKEDLYAYLPEGRSEAEARAAELHDRYRLEPLARLSTRALYRKNLYLLDTLEKATHGLPLPFSDGRGIKALDVGSQDWYYVFALERWLQSHNREGREPVQLTGIELDGYEIYADFHSRQDYARAYAEQTGNPQVRYQVGDFLKVGAGEQDIIFLFYPLLLRHHLLLWGLPLRYFAPKALLSQAAALTRPGGWLVVFCHTQPEHEVLLELARATGGFQLLREGGVVSNLVESHAQTMDRRFSIWKRTGLEAL